MHYVQRDTLDTHTHLVNKAGSDYGQQGPTTGSDGGVRRRGVAAGSAWHASDRGLASGFGIGTGRGSA